MDKSTGFRNVRNERTILFTPREKHAGDGSDDGAKDARDDRWADDGALGARDGRSSDGGTRDAQDGMGSGDGARIRNGRWSVDLVIIGGGAAGMAAAVSARRCGVQDILILERNSSPGGVLQQCIHNGFGLHRFGEDLTGVEFAARYADMVREMEIPVLLNTFVIALDSDKTITAVSPEKGLLEIRAKSIVLAMGCRERSRNALLIPGARGAGIMTAGTAQRYLNLDGYLPGKRIVIVGSGDIGLIMARQFVLEGCEVAAVVEIMPFSGGLPRNMKQCIEDFDIPVYYNSVIAEVRGKERVSSVLVGKVDAQRRLIPGSEFEIACDTLLISAGLIPENELTEAAGIAMSAATKGAKVSETLETSLPGVFSCGNVLHVHDLVDFVSEEGEEAGRNAAAWLRDHESRQPGAVKSPQKDENALPGAVKDLRKDENVQPGAVKDLRKDENALPGAEAAPALRIPALAGAGVGGIVPHYVHSDTPCKEVSFMFRPKMRCRDAVITAASGGRELFRRRSPALTPGEMCRVTISADKLAEADASGILFSIEGTPV